MTPTAVIAIPAIGAVCAMVASIVTTYLKTRADIRKAELQAAVEMFSRLGNE